MVQPADEREQRGYGYTKGVCYSSTEATWAHRNAPGSRSRRRSTLAYSLILDEGCRYVGS